MSEEPISSHKEIREEDGTLVVTEKDVPAGMGNTDRGESSEKLNKRLF